MTPLEPFVLAPAAFLAGVLMFLAPCTLPIVPGYLAFIAGNRGNVMRNAAAFVLGFSIIFIALGAAAGFLGGIIAPYREILVAVGGGILVFFGLVLLGVKIPFLSGQSAIPIPKWLTVGSPSSSLLIGSFFALGWSPCIGPVLGTVLLFASSSTTALQGAILLAFFAIGLGIPFMLTAFLLDKAQHVFVRWAGATALLSKFGGAVLIALGLLMIIGKTELLLVWGADLLGPLYTTLLNYL